MTAQSTTYNVTATGVVIGRPCTYRGLTISSTVGSTVVVYDNASAASGTILAQFTVAAGGTVHFDIADGVQCTGGIFMTATAAVQGHIRVG